MSLDVFYSYCVFVVRLQLVIDLITFLSTFLGLLLGPLSVFQRLGGALYYNRYSGLTSLSLVWWACSPCSVGFIDTHLI